MDDRDIIDLYWARDQRAVGETAAKYGPYCAAVADNILHDSRDTEECVNDTWLKAWNAMPPQRPQRLKLFLARITRNLAFDRWRKGSAQRRGGGELPLALEELGECVPGQDEVEGTVAAAELAESMQRFLAARPALDRDLFLRRYFYVESAAAIARRYGMSREKVSMRLMRARKKLKDHLTEEGYL